MSTINFNSLPDELQAIISKHMSVEVINLVYKYVGNPGIRKLMRKVKEDIWYRKGFHVVLDEEDLEGAMFFFRQVRTYTDRSQILKTSIMRRDLESFKKAYAVYQKYRLSIRDETFEKMVENLLVTENTDIFKFLYEEEEPYMSYNSIDIAIKSGDLDTAEWLYQKDQKRVGEDIENLAVHYFVLAVDSGNREMAEWLASKGANPLDYMFSQ